MGLEIAIAPQTALIGVSVETNYCEPLRINLMVPFVRATISIPYHRSRAWMVQAIEVGKQPPLLNLVAIALGGELATSYNFLWRKEIYQWEFDELHQAEHFFLDAASLWHSGS